VVRISHYGKNKNEKLVERLAKHPELRARIAQILTLVENSQGDANTADEAEQRAVEEVRKLGQEVLGAWAVAKEQQLEPEYDRRRDYRRKGKNENHQKFAEFVSNLSDSEITFAPPNKWTAGQQLDHILRGVSPVKTALSLPKFVPNLLDIIGNKVCQPKVEFLPAFSTRKNPNKSRFGG
jgi:hypothetical protein